MKATPRPRKPEDTSANEPGETGADKAESVSAVDKVFTILAAMGELGAVSYTHLTLPTNTVTCRSRWSPYH